MITLLIATVGLGFFYGALWHNEPARRPNREKQDELESAVLWDSSALHRQ